MHPAEADVATTGHAGDAVLAVTSLLAANPDPSDDEIDAAITNICRCGTYNRIRSAIHTAKTRLAETVQ